MVEGSERVELDQVEPAVEVTEPPSGDSLDSEASIPAKPEPIKWKPVFLPSAIAMGILVDVGAEVVFQQLGWTLITLNDLLYNAVEGALLGIIAPSLGALIGAVYVNRKIRRLDA